MGATLLRSVTKPGDPRATLLRSIAKRGGPQRTRSRASLIRRRGRPWMRSRAASTAGRRPALQLQLRRLLEILRRTASAPLQQRQTQEVMAARIAVEVLDGPHEILLGSGIIAVEIVVQAGRVEFLSLHRLRNGQPVGSPLDGMVVNDVLQPCHQLAAEVRLQTQDVGVERLCPQSLDGLGLCLEQRELARCPCGPAPHRPAC